MSRDAQRELGPAFALPPEQAQALAAAIAEPRLVAFLASSARSSWRAAAWLLERTAPERWGPNRVVVDEDETPIDGGPDPFAEVDELAERRDRRPFD